jgi:rhodanese-related sulfurtransferase
MLGNLFGNKKITPAEAKERLAKDKSIVLLDVRSPQEYKQGHIPKSISLPLDKLQNKVEKVVPNKDTEVFVYCLSGSRASSACSIMKQLGYTNVSNLGGITSWPYGIIK